MPCPACGEHVPAGAQTCPICGTAPFAPGGPRDPEPVSVGAPSPAVSQTAGFTPPPPPAPPSRQFLPPTALGWPGTPSMPGSTAPVDKPPKWPAVVALVVVLALIAGGLGYIGIQRHKSPRFPSAWDPRVAPIATKVAELRHLSFEHPVKVNYLTNAAFEKKVGVDADEVAKNRSELDSAAALLRAAGVIGGKVDVAAAVDTTQTSDVVAFYDPDSKQIFVRSDSFDIYTRATLAHELTHVLQDQNFDLVKLQKQADDSKAGSSDAFTALIEGDAMRIQDAYLAQQTAADRAQYDKLSSKFSDTAGQRTKDVPAIFDTFLGAPYEFGPSVISVLKASDGDTAINDAITGPTPNTNIYLDPTTADATPKSVPAPALHAGEKRLASSSSDPLDPFSLYVMLASRLDARTALAAADAYGGASELDYTSGTKTCFRASIVGRDAAATASLRAVLRDWAATMPSAVIERASNVITFHTCDPGTDAKAPSDTRINDAISLAVTRDEVTALLVQQFQAAQPGLSSLAPCVSRLLMSKQNVADLLFKSVATMTPAEKEAVQQASFQAGAACRLSSDAGLPGH